MTAMLFLSVLCTAYVLPIQVASSKVATSWHQAETPDPTAQLPPPQDHLMGLPLTELRSHYLLRVDNTRQAIISALGVRETRKLTGRQDWVPPPMKF